MGEKINKNVIHQLPNLLVDFVASHLDLRMLKAQTPHKGCTDFSTRIRRLAFILGSLINSKNMLLLVAEEDHVF